MSSTKPTTHSKFRHILSICPDVIEKVNLKKLGSKRSGGLKVVVDGSALYYLLYAQKVEWTFGGENLRFHQVVTSFCESMTKANVKMFVIMPDLFTVPTDEEQTEETLARMSGKASAAAAFTSSVIASPYQSFYRRTKSVLFHPLAAQVMIAALRENGAKVQCTPGPFLPRGIALAQEKGWPVIGYDTALLAAPIPSYIHSDSIITHASGDVTANLVRPKRLAEASGFSLEILQTVTRLLPNPALPPHALAAFRASLPQEEPATALAEWVKERGVEAALVEAVEQQLELREPEEGRELMPEADLRKGVEESASLFLGHVTEFQGLKAVPKYVGSFLRGGKLPSWVGQALRYQQVWIAPGVENYALPAAACSPAAAAIRASVYSLVSADNTVTEYVRMEGTTEYTAVPVESPTSETTLSDIKKLKGAERRELFCRLAGVPTLPATIPKDMQMAAVLLRLVMQHLDLTPVMASAVATMLVHPPTSGALARVLGQELLKRDLPMMHTGAQLLHILDALTGLNALTGALSVKLETLFSGASLLLCLENEQAGKGPISKWGDLVLGAEPVTAPERGEGAVLSKHEREMIAIAPKLELLRIILAYVLPGTPLEGRIGKSKTRRGAAKGRGGLSSSTAHSSAGTKYLLLMGDEE
eukprot:gnl/Dysnectes_brevis/412_a454_3744.p1 GENE.gnl/Dysnectes_brevis/412_a454_3744~~gnl/Dysnectes_brevis/412_a454_3744.p1  ORF type:complete len:647 (-),score=260.89 gnl/Dysnectes_brevis/412_a454_3744:39-1979(-)